MAVNLKLPTDLYAVPGVRLASVYAGVRSVEKADLVLIELQAGSKVAVTFTQNIFCAAPVTVAKQHVSLSQPRYLLINAGNANAGTGDRGLQDAKQCCTSLATLTDSVVESILPFSTGVIGEYLPVDKLQQAFPALIKQLVADNWLNAAQAIMTTDTVPKAFSTQLCLAGKTVTITGMAKGAGMICPNMATMLAYIATDAEIDADLLQILHQQAIAKSFNSITVDGDTSTNDASMLIATAAAGLKITQQNKDIYTEFVTALEHVYLRLAQAIIRDAEGANKFVTITVEQGRTVADCRQIAYTVAHSPLVKTALFASDANWGRILAAVGRAGVEIDIQKINLQINGVSILKNGQPDPAYQESSGATAMSAEEIEIHIMLAQGQAAWTVWTSDLSHDYVSINADYRS